MAVAGAPHLSPAERAALEQDYRYGSARPILPTVRSEVVDPAEKEAVNCVAQISSRRTGGM